MRITRALSALAICLLAASSSNAQTRRGRPRARAAMWNALELTQAQRTRVDAIHVRYAPAAKIAQKQSADSSARVFGREMAEVRELLTIPQRQIFDTYMAGNPKPRRGSVARVAPAKIAVPR